VSSQILQYYQLSILQYQPQHIATTGNPAYGIGQIGLIETTSEIYQLVVQMKKSGQ